jgi:hypothetical protein
MIDPENKAYLDKIVEHVMTMDDAKQNTVQYLIEHKIKDKVKIENCIIVSQIWAANQMKKPIRMIDILISLGTEADADDDPKLNDDVSIVEEYRGLPLRKLLDVIIQADGALFE